MGFTNMCDFFLFFFFFSSRRRHTRYWRDWSSTCALPIFVCPIGALGALCQRAAPDGFSLSFVLQQVATILICPRFDAPWADQTGSTSSPHMRIMRYGSCPLKSAVELVGVEVLGQSTSSAFYVKRYPQVLCSPSRLWSDGALRDIYRLQTLPASGHLVGHLLALVEGLKSAARYACVVHEHILATIFWGDEAEALLDRKSVV